MCIPWRIVLLLFFCFPAVAQISASCGHPDPNNYDQVFACMSSYRYGGLAGGRNVFEATGMTSCTDVSVNYFNALKKSGLSPEDALALTPSCDFLARGLEAITGKPTFWAACAHYPGHFDPNHMQACLTQFLPGYYGDNRTLASLHGCADAIREYELGLTSAYQGKTDLGFGRGLPPGYEKPDCQQVIALIGGQGSACLAYQPGIPHLQQCLGPEVAQFTDCIPLRQRYEQKLREAYGGTLPPNYTMLACEQLAGLTDANKATLAARRAEAMRRQQELLARQQSAQGPSWNGTGGTSGLLKTLFFSWLGAPFFFALLVHGGISVWALLYAGRQIRSGNWNVVGNFLTAAVYERLFRWKLLFVQGVVLLAGWWFTHWPWLVGAFLVIPLSRIALIVLMAIGVFHTPRRRPGPVTVEGFPHAPEPRNDQKTVDQGVSDEWGS